MNRNLLAGLLALFLISCDPHSTMETPPDTPEFANLEAPLEDIAKSTLSAQDSRYETDTFPMWSIVKMALLLWRF